MSFKLVDNLLEKMTNKNSRDTNKEYEAIEMEEEGLIPYY